MLLDLRGYGLQDVTLRPDASDTEWGRVLSLGEDELAVTSQQLASFFSAIGQDGAKLFLKTNGAKVENRSRRRRTACFALLKIRAGSRGTWYLAHAKALSVALPNSYFQSLGLPNLEDER